MSQEETNSFSSDFSYLFFRNGASFRINYNDTDEKPLNQPRILSLSDLCCSIVVRNEFLTEQACDTIPKELFNQLFRAALHYTQDDSCINILISRWPYRVFRLENFVDEKLTSLKMLLSEKESRRNQLIDIYNQQHHQLSPESNTFDYNSNEYRGDHPTNSHDNNDDLVKSSSYPDDTIIIRFDCIIQDYRTYVELLSALRSTTPNIQLQICTIDMRCIGLALVSSFLDHVDKRFVHTLRIPYNVLTRQNLKYFLPRLPSLTQLHTLDLSCNFIDFRLNQEDLDQFCDVLSQLKYLKHLSLSGSPITNRLEYILNAIDHSLDVLNLDFCSLYENDLISLSQMSTRHQFLHLDLGTNRLNRFMRQLLIVLIKQARLVVLDLDYNRFSSNDYLELIACCQRIQTLKSLSLRGPNSLTTQLAAATFIGEHYKCLRAWKIASPIEYSLNRFVGNDEQNYLIQTIMPYDMFISEMNKRAKCLVSISELSV
ncbi:unnamed protein product [Rotaria magnacalcarata]|uniref:Uncharacterized protein n=1 Tax=Rotaria magnacalcarata TaxID=392030 RepID=A0A814XAF0_9BILA|nr:unnamed protein product [Rotaria magnacalcarata]CAF4216426.1 unnamed protein product [Rotaria magnacalcarata]